MKSVPLLALFLLLLSLLGCKTQGYTETLSGGVKLEMVAIPSGSFMMGSKADTASQPIHKVILNPFFMGKFEITQAQWKAVMISNPSKFTGNDRPVECVSWSAAKEFCKKLSEMTGKEFRLPSEAEWEYAARAGASGDYCFGDDVRLLVDYAWYFENSDYETHPVGRKKPNVWGLYDMHGNVSEWCEDTYHGNYEGAPTDGSAWVTGGVDPFYVMRGGAWYYDQVGVRATSRSIFVPAPRFLTYTGLRSGSFGFRVVRTR